jgi:hypothetical protein
MGLSSGDRLVLWAFSWYFVFQKRCLRPWLHVLGFGLLLGFREMQVSRIVHIVV